MAAGGRKSLWAEAAVALGLGAAALFLLKAPLAGYGALGLLVAGPVLGLLRVQNFADAYMRLFLPAAAGAALYALYGAAHGSADLEPLLNGRFDDFDQYTFEQYYAVMSTLFAIITALILVKGIENFDRLNAVIVEEANQVRAVFEFLYYFEEDDSAPDVDRSETLRKTAAIRAELSQYCAQAAEDPAARLAHEATTILRRTTKIVGALDCVDNNDSVALGEVMRSLNLLFATRARRVAFSRARVPLYMIVTLGFMSLAVVLPFFIGDPALHPLNAWIVFVLSAFCAFLLLLLRDINTPFDGFWRVDLEAMRAMRRDIEERAAQDAMVEASRPPSRDVSIGAAIAADRPATTAAGGRGGALFPGATAPENRAQGGAQPLDGVRQNAP